MVQQRYLGTAAIALALNAVTTPVLAQDATASASPPRLVAEAVIQQRSDNITWPVTSVTIHGRPVSVALDLGSTAEGILGTVSLARYDLVFDGPAGKVLVYAAPASSPAPSRPSWFPAGMTAADCIPMEPDSLHDFLAVFPVQIQGKTIHGMFDSGAKEAVLTMATANTFGITAQTPGVQPFDLKGAHYFDRRTDTQAWSVRSLPVTVGGDSVLKDQIAIIQNMPGFRKGHSNDPRINFGVDSFREYLLYISYSARQVCLSRPDRKTK